jgi:uncharacterized protein (UPF0548 family)
MIKTKLSLVLSVSLLVLASAVSTLGGTPPERRLVAAEGRGYLETVNGCRVLHLKGSPDEMGYQHGVLMQDAVRENVTYLLENAAEETVEFLGMKMSRDAIARALVETFKDKVPERFVQEMQALARGSDLPEWKVVGTNLIPEFMHCSGFALLKEATAAGKLLHGRVLDYGVDMRLQDHAVLMIVEPDGHIPFVNVSYAGFIGSVTGMNLEQVSIGEMGGGGVGMWDGIPMSFLVRMVLEEARSLEQALDVFRNHPRTCEYYYVIADARANTAAGIKATPTDLDIVRPGEHHVLLPTPIANTVLLSAGDRYGHLVRGTQAGYGAFTAESAIRLMDAPVAMKSNLHNALMIPEDGVLYVAHADTHKNPAWKQPYQRFDLHALMAQRPPVTGSWESLFDGTSLAGWKGDAKLWSVRDGAIVGTTSADDPLPYNTFLIWEGPPVRDFELTLKLAMMGKNNSGIQYRSQEVPAAGDFVVGGYQMDIHPNPPYSGMLYEERGRGIVAQRPTQVIVERDGKKRVVETLGEAGPINLEDWNTYTITARGNRLVHKINGVVTVDITDRQEDKAATSGIIALQLHRGPSMQIKVRDIRLKRFE